MEPKGLKTYDYLCESCDHRFIETVDYAKRDVVKCPLGFSRHFFNSVLRFRNPFSPVRRTPSAPMVSQWRSNQTILDKSVRMELGEASKLKELFVRRKRKLDKKERMEIRKTYKRLKGEPLRD